MARKSRIASSSSSTTRPRRVRAAIPEAYRVVASATVAANGDTKVPMLVLCGDWLDAIGFPVGSSAYLTTDARGELSLSRLGLRLPRRLTVRTTPR